MALERLLPGCPVKRTTLHYHYNEGTFHTKTTTHLPPHEAMDKPYHDNTSYHYYSEYYQPALNPSKVLQQV
jgi:hypothetical protein